MGKTKRKPTSWQLVTWHKPWLYPAAGRNGFCNNSTPCPDMSHRSHAVGIGLQALTRNGMTQCLLMTAISFDHSFDLFRLYPYVEKQVKHWYRKSRSTLLTNCGTVKIYVRCRRPKSVQSTSYSSTAKLLSTLNFGVEYDSVQRTRQQGPELASCPMRSHYLGEFTDDYHGHWWQRHGHQRRLIYS